MKNLIKLALSMLMPLIILSGCDTPMSMKTVVNEPHFAGVVVEVYEGSILVKVNEGEDARKSSDLINVPLNVKLKDSIGEYMSGDEVIVYYDGTIMEFYPAQLSRVYAIVLISPSKLDDWISVSAIEVSYFSGGRFSDWIITDKQEIDILYKWYFNLSLTKEQFADGESPGDENGGEIYSFTLLQENGDKIPFSYGKYGADRCYLIYDNEWYKVNNPTNSPISFDEIINLDKNGIGFAAQYIRTDGYVDGAEYPVFTVITSKNELDTYYEAYKNLYDFLYSFGSSSISFTDAIEKYSDDFFTDNILVIILLEEGSGSIRHQVESVDGNGEIVINRLLPEMGTDDMAEWNIIIEMKQYNYRENFNVVLKDKQN